ncbi:tRNA (uridine(54)-C5)-methyltransferase TrmA [Hydrogenimonas thermophila]|uniref:tRNA (uridine(54)-C5)-methyltransferase TrmA n=1 Tax=Hydrogenimonas thermophila TaxID=223786 RepID=UPI002936FA05|nr:tRNA (uridine(54)-C5)-methyltransferase TrmA [Hydrogenimonas thermophila]WOE71027.1 tRNA (uridine(54)-C5)-methyltransferase TrmA [Hydrogenimonas thermophila]WOE73545.1 tRNA (uridine(54)-C5)-methyltransferase TrmA [Hydrogenimonas thermophila]
MICKHFSECGSCSLYEMEYSEQLEMKKENLQKLLEPFFDKNITAFSSEKEYFRARAEYKIYHKDNSVFYAMRHLDKKAFVTLEECKMVSQPIQKRMWKLLEIVNECDELKNRLFGVEFLSSSTDDVLITMLYHRKLDESWMQKAKTLENELSAKVIGRSRKQKIVLSEEFVTETLNINGKSYHYLHYEQSFTQPNTKVNEKMIEWAVNQAKSYEKGDFCELYAGSGNFTLPISNLFEKVIATEISKRSIYAALENCKLNNINNITFIRMSSEEFTEALEKVRTFTRLKDIDLDSFDIGTILVDPPRAGLDEQTKSLISKFDTIIYISCNPNTLARDLETLCKTHNVKDAALFDQFPYTHHMEAGVVLTKR